MHMVAYSSFVFYWHLLVSLCKLPPSQPKKTHTHTKTISRNIFIRTSVVIFSSLDGLMFASTIYFVQAFPYLFNLLPFFAPVWACKPPPEIKRSCYVRSPRGAALSQPHYTGRAYHLKRCTKARFSAAKKYKMWVWREFYLARFCDYFSKLSV